MTLVTGPVSLDPPPGVACIRVQTCDEMAGAMLEQFPRADIIIKVAAVADYKPIHCQDQKIKKTPGQKGLTLEMAENTDILRQLGARKKKNQFLVGFAAETHDLEAHARSKMEKKNLDMIVANTVGVEGSGFQADTNKVKIFLKQGSIKNVPLMEKDQVAHILLDTVLEHQDQ